MDILDPRTLPQDQEPFIVFCNQNDFVSTAIDWRTHLQNYQPWDHAMLSISQGRFVTQTMGIFNAYRDIPMDLYMKEGTQLAFVQLVNNSPDFTKAFSKSVQKRLLASWWVTQYDYIGVFFGQLVGFPELIHTPGLEYCSVDVIRHLVNACPYLPKEDQLVINNIPRESNPEGLWKIILDNPNVFKVYGQYDSKIGVIA